MLISDLIATADLTSAADLRELSDALEEVGRTEEANLCRSDAALPATPSVLPLVRFTPIDQAGGGPIVARLRQIDIYGKRWFQRSYGNTYHTVVVYVNGREVFSSTKQYGYGDQYRQTAQEWLEQNGLLPGLIGSEPLWRYRDRTGIGFGSDVTDVPRERDL